MVDENSVARLTYTRFLQGARKTALRPGRQCKGRTLRCAPTERQHGLLAARLGVCRQLLPRDAAQQRRQQPIILAGLETVIQL